MLELAHAWLSYLMNRPTITFLDWSGFSLYMGTPTVQELTVVYYCEVCANILLQKKQIEEQS